MKILLHPDLAEMPEWQALMSKRGYEVTVGHHGYDLAIGPDCWYFTPKHGEFAEMAVKHARALKKDSKQLEMFPEGKDALQTE